jgi:hypothetical protein
MQVLMKERELQRELAGMLPFPQPGATNSNEKN